MRPPTRRELVQRAVAAAVSGAAAGVVLGPEGALAAAETDADVIYRLLATELLIVFTYQHVLQLGLMAQPAARIAGELAVQERVHAAALGAELGRLGAAAPQAPGGLAAANGALAAGDVNGSLAGLRTEQDCLKLLIGLESLAERAYFDAIGKLHNPGLAQTAARIMACEAQHWTALAELRYPRDITRAVPDAYVTGTD